MYESVTHALITAQVFSCFFMTGLIWLIQLVHYPAFYFIDPKSFLKFHAFHSQSITWIVGPVMGIELVTAIGLCLLRTQIVYINLFSVLVLWALTALVSVPIHIQLAQSLNLELVRQLIMTNWFRTCIWSLRALAMIDVTYNLLQNQKGV
jgi:hypothetical protein